jgi:hypothetical protein
VSAKTEDYLTRAINMKGRIGIGQSKIVDEFEKRKVAWVSPMPDALTLMTLGTEVRFAP